MRTIIWYVTFVITLILRTGDLYRLKKLRKTISDKEFTGMANEIVKKWAAIQIRTSGARFHVTGNENIPRNKAALFVSNHQSNFDTAVFISLIDSPKGYMSKSEMLKVPLLRSWMKYINCVFLDRDDIKKSAKAILDGIENLKNGYSMVVFPEGTRSKGDVMGEFKAGSFKLATKSKVPIIPVTINGTYKIMEANNNRIKPADVYIHIHKPVYTENLTPEETAELPAKIKDIIASKLPAQS